ncbi:MAG TPA: hypothetical protein VEO55_02890 [Candidatus Dormibacteraeota bacterium]|nr:hypothetical protein [Candidatus Dormibacteraeota bacterium]
MTRTDRIVIVIFAIAAIATIRADVPRAYAAEHAAETAKLEVAGGEVEVVFTPSDYKISRDAILAWIERSARAVSTYYGRFPVRRYRVTIFAAPARHGVMSGTTWGFGGAHSRIILGVDTRQNELDSDWVMTHEMVHLAFPSVSRDHHWIEEGIATYVEPIARAEIGNYPVQQVWQDLIVGLPKGMPANGDAGLDHTPTWGRMYWGGAMFCVLADVGIRRRTHNRYGLADALSGVLAAGGNIEAEWPLERALKAADDAVGAPVMTELYAQMKSAPVEPDLTALWKTLGVEERATGIAFNDAAPEASIRRAITTAH